MTEQRIDSLTKELEKENGYLLLIRDGNRFHYISGGKKTEMIITLAEAMYQDEQLHIIVASANDLVNEKMGAPSIIGATKN